MKLRRSASESSLARLLHSASESWQRREFEEYFAAMERASRLDPANYRVLLDLGLAYGMRYAFDASERCLDKAVRLAPEKARALEMAGTHCRNVNRFELARKYFERAVAEPGVSPDTFVKLAEIYERLRLIEQAEDMVGRALKRNPQLPLALLVRARLFRLSGRLEEAERAVRSFLSNSDPDTWSTRIRGWYELGAILDRQERYSDAMLAFLEAKALIRPNAERFSAPQQSVRAQLETAAVEITADVLERWRGRRIDRPQRFALLCGHPRSGTTLLEQVMDSHPDIISSEETPILYETYLDLKKSSERSDSIRSLLESASSQALLEARENYFRFTEALLENKINGRLLIDKNPSLTTMIPAVMRILPETKLLVALRDPRDVCISFFMQPLPLNLSSAAYLSLEGTVAEYASLMGFWRALAPRLPEGYLEIRYEDLIADLETVSRRVLAFLGVPWDARVLRFNEHAREKLVRSPTYADVTKPVFRSSMGRWRNYQKYLEPWLEKLEPFVKAFGYE